MSDENLKYMLAKVKQDTLLWNAITPEERIVATLRFLATGRSFEDPKFATIISPNALGNIIPETCKAIYTYKALKQEHLKFANSSIEWQKIAKDFERKVCTKLVPKVLTGDQKSRRVETCQELLDLCESDPHFLDNVITGDKTWVFEYDPETKRQSAEWHISASPCPKKGRMSKSKVKVILIVFFDIRGLVHLEFVPHGTTINAKL
ncbi:hypothetical protein B7P43_G15109 [Cryptotermes secundus]|uniref:Uncharacterized protein n=1 Tax=Cryptotermes secundus TaxID=105785 RepID=A0A2J7PIR1_9NEOP|nr:hypothetical protein B7P43_G15109 [Cryptotermes secundus]